MLGLWKYYVDNDVKEIMIKLLGNIDTLHIEIAIAISN